MNNVKSYTEILKDTAVRNSADNPNDNKPRSNQSYKWRKIISHIWQKIKADEGLSDEDEDEFEDANE